MAAAEVSTYCHFFNLRSIFYIFNFFKAQAEKDKGNEAYKKKDFVLAHKHYDKAIELDPTNVTFLTNKAGKQFPLKILCFNFIPVLFYFILAAFYEEAKYDECIKCCENAVEIGREHRADYHLIAK